MHVIAAKAVALKEDMEPGFKTYQTQVVKNAQTLAQSLQEKNWKIFSGGTDNHLMLLNLAARGLTGKQASAVLGQARITVNKNAIPFDETPPATAGGIRLGTPAVTTRGMKEPEMKAIGALIDRVLVGINDAAVAEQVGRDVKMLTDRFPLYPELHKLS